MNISLIDRKQFNCYWQKWLIAEQLKLSTCTIDSRLKDMEPYIKNGRYPKESIMRDGGLVLINYLAFIDFINVRGRLRDKYLSKGVEPYNPREIAKGLGWVD